MKHLMTGIHVVTGLVGGILLGTWLFMLCFGPFGFLFFVSEALDPATLTRLDGLPGKPLAFAMLGVGLMLARHLVDQLEADQDRNRQGDGDHQILLFVHGSSGVPGTVEAVCAPGGVKVWRGQRVAGGTGS